MHLNVEDCRVFLTPINVSLESIRRISLNTSLSAACRDKARGDTEMVSDQMNFIGPSGVQLWRASSKGRD